jgi:SAM-dependent methyltransferase
MYASGVSQYTDGSYAVLNPTWHDEDAVWKADQVARLLTSRQIRPRSLCDIGCGTGGVLASLHGRLDAPTLVGWDISPYAAAIASSRHPEIEVRCGDLLATDESYEVVLALDVFEHVEDYLGFLRSLARHGRQFVFHIPLDMSAQRVLRVWPLLQNRERLGHLHYFSKDTALATIRTAGYVIEHEGFTRLDQAQAAQGALDLPKSRLHRLGMWAWRIGMRVAPELTVRVFGGCSLLVLARPSDGNPRGPRFPAC